MRTDCSVSVCSSQQSLNDCERRELVTESVDWDADTAAAATTQLINSASDESHQVI